MPRKRHSAEEIVAKLRQADVLLAQGQTGADAPECWVSPRRPIIDGGLSSVA